MFVRLDYDIRIEDLDSRTPPDPSHQVGGIAYDFRNLIHIIAVVANRMKKSTQDIRILKQCDLIIDVCRMAFELVNDVLCMARGDQGAFHEMNLNRLAKQRADLLAGTLPGNVQFHMDLDPSLPPVAGNASQIRQVIMNLINNARDAVRKGGQISIKSREVHLEEVHGQGDADVRPGDFAALTVSDTGPGISPHMLSKIFAPFVSTKNSRENAGLGLTVARTIVKSHQGWIDVKSQIGQGACFTIFLPLVSTIGDRKSGNTSSV